MHTELSGPLSAANDVACSVTQRINQLILDQLFSHTFKTVLIHIIASFLVLVWLADVATASELTLWFGAITFISCAKLVLHWAYSRYVDGENSELWLHAWTGLSALMSCVYVIGLVHFSPFEQAEYAVAAGLLIIGLSAVNIMLFSASMYAVLSFLLPLTLLPCYFLILQGGQAGTITALTLGCYSLAVVMLISNISKAFKKSILVSLQHQHELDKRKRIEQQLQDAERRDGLTRVFTRNYFDERLATEIGRAHRNHQPLCVLMFDIDCFKQYNDEYGHIAGDTCLADIAGIAQTLANRQGDLTARYGGEEFAIILPNIDLRGATAFANKLQNEIEKKKIPHATTKLTTLKCVTISVGVTNLMPFTKSKPSELVKYAETALFEAKRQGRNRVHFTQNNGVDHSAPL